MFTYEKLPGLSRDRVVDAIEPVLRARGLCGVAIVWQSEAGGRVLRITVEYGAEGVPSEAGAVAEEAAEPSVDGVTLEVCAEVSREISARLDETEAIDCPFHLEVGSPGLERPLYVGADYQRFVGRLARLKLSVPFNHEYSHQGILGGLSETGAIRLQVDNEVREIPLENVRTGQLVVDWNPSGKASSRSKKQNAWR